MASSQKILSDLVADHLNSLSRSLLEDVVAEKLEAVGIPAKDLASKLIEHALSGNQEKFTWDTDNAETRDITISITDDDATKIMTKLNHFAEERLPAIFQTASNKSAVDLLEELKKQWPGQRAWEELTTAQFRENLEARWGKGLNLLRLLLSICMEIGKENLRKHNRSKRKRIDLSPGISSKNG